MSPVGNRQERRERTAPHPSANADGAWTQRRTTGAGIVARNLVEIMRPSLA